jgi:organic radical activating enzyme
MEQTKIKKNFSWVEIFRSQEGEGPYSNRNVVYYRSVGCNFECAGFNNPDGVKITKEVLGFDAKNFIEVTQLPEITIGCDSIYAWHPDFAHMWQRSTVDEVHDEFEKLLPYGKWVHPISHQPYILSLTGGEPTNQQKHLPTMFLHERMADCRHILIETNCAVTLKQPFIDAICTWLSQDNRRKWTWSNSPKLSISGESHEAAIRPEVALMQRQVIDKFPLQCDQYFKFVCDASDAAFDEVQTTMVEYFSAGIPSDIEVWIMPMACTDDQQKKIAVDVAEMCLQRGYLFSYRIQNALYGNAIGK